MSEEVRRVEVITSVQRRRRWSVAEKIRLVEETLEPGMSVSFVARKHGLSPSLLFKWRQRMAEGGREAVRVDDDRLGTEPVGDGGRTLVRAEVPQMEIVRYAIDLRSMSHGTGTFTRRYVRHEPMPPQVAAKVQAESQR